MSRFLAGHPGAVQDPIGGLVEEDQRAREVALSMGEPMVVVPAPEEVWPIGLGTVGAFTRATLERVFPVNP
jgi:hypothetical protein